MKEKADAYDQLVSESKELKGKLETFTKTVDNQEAELTKLTQSLQEQKDKAVSVLQVYYFFWLLTCLRTSQSVY